MDCTFLVDSQVVGNGRDFVWASGAGECLLFLRPLYVLVKALNIGPTYVRVCQFTSSLFLVAFILSLCLVLLFQFACHLLFFQATLYFSFWTRAWPNWPLFFISQAYSSLISFLSVKQTAPSLNLFLSISPPKVASLKVSDSASFWKLWLLDEVEVQNVPIVPYPEANSVSPGEGGESVLRLCLLAAFRRLVLFLYLFQA